MINLVVNYMNETIIKNILLCLYQMHAECDIYCVGKEDRRKINRKRKEINTDKKAKILDF